MRLEDEDFRLGCGGLAGEPCFGVGGRRQDQVRREFARAREADEGSLAAAAPSDPTVGFAEAVLAAAARPWLYARVDVVETEEGTLLMELELIEPDLFLTPSGATRLADGLVAAVEERA